MGEYVTRPENKPIRKKKPKLLAVVDQNGCTGCEACIVVCPVDCIEIVPGDYIAELMRLVEIDLERCIGCQKCAKACPWDTITMFDHDQAYTEANQVTLRSVVYGTDGPPATPPQ